MLESKKKLYHFPRLSGLKDALLDIATALPIQLSCSEVTLSLGLALGVVHRSVGTPDSAIDYFDGRRLHGINRPFLIPMIAPVAAVVLSLAGQSEIVLAEAILTGQATPQGHRDRGVRQADRQASVFNSRHLNLTLQRRIVRAKSGRKVQHAEKHMLANKNANANRKEMYNVGKYQIYSNPNLDEASAKAGREAPSSGRFSVVEVVGDVSSRRTLRDKVFTETKIPVAFLTNCWSSAKVLISFLRF